MVASSGAEAHSNSDKKSTYEVGMCQKYTRESWEVGSLYGSAIDAWNGAKYKHKGDRNPPQGAPCYYSGGNYGHAVVFQSYGKGNMRSTDCPSSGKVSDTDLGWPERQWGYKYLGWTGDINGVTCPNLSKPSDPSDPGGDDDMPYYDHGIMKTDTKLPAGKWVRIKWDTVTGDGAMDEGSGGVHIGTRRYTASAHFSVTAPKGSTLRAQVYEYQKGDSAPVESNPTVEFTATDGNSYFEYNHNGAVAKERGLIFQVQCSQDATLLNADVVVLSWKP